MFHRERHSIMDSILMVAESNKMLPVVIAVMLGLEDYYHGQLPNNAKYAYKVQDLEEAAR